MHQSLFGLGNPVATPPEQFVQAGAATARADVGTEEGASFGEVLNGHIKFLRKASQDIENNSSTVETKVATSLPSPDASASAPGVLPDTLPGDAEPDATSTDPSILLVTPHALLVDGIAPGGNTLPPGRQMPVSAASEGDTERDPLRNPAGIVLPGTAQAHVFAADSVGPDRGEASPAAATQASPRAMLLAQGRPFETAAPVPTPGTSVVDAARVGLPDQHVMGDPDIDGATGDSVPATVAGLRPSASRPGDIGVGFRGAVDVERSAATVTNAAALSPSGDDGQSGTVERSFVERPLGLVRSQALDSSARAVSPAALAGTADGSVRPQAAFDAAFGMPVSGLDATSGPSAVAMTPSGSPGNPGLASGSGLPGQRIGMSAGDPASAPPSDPASRVSASPVPTAPAQFLADDAAIRTPPAAGMVRLPPGLQSRVVPVDAPLDASTAVTYQLPLHAAAARSGGAHSLPGAAPSAGTAVQPPGGMPPAVAQSAPGMRETLPETGYLRDAVLADPSLPASAASAGPALSGRTPPAGAPVTEGAPGVSSEVTPAGGDDAAVSPDSPDGTRDMRGVEAAGASLQASAADAGVSARPEAADRGFASSLSAAVGRVGDATAPASPLPQAPGSLPVLLGAATGRLGEELGQRILWLSGHNLRSAEIQLDPPELGPLQVQVHSHRDGASVQFVTHSATVRDAVESNLPRLRELLEGSGLNLLDVNVAQQQQQRDARGEREALEAASQASRGRLASMGQVGEQPAAVRRRVGLVDDYA